MRFAIALVVSALCLQAPAARAQQYSHKPGETLHYRQVSKITNQADGPNGPINLESTSNALITVAFLPGDTARIWYDSLDTNIDSPVGKAASPYLRQMVGNPFLIQFRPNGDVIPLTTPTVE